MSRLFIIILLFCSIFTELQRLHHSTNIVRVIKSRRLQWAGHVARMDESRGSLKILTHTSTGNIPSGL